MSKHTHMHPQAWPQRRRRGHKIGVGLTHSTRVRPGSVAQPATVHAHTRYNIGMVSGCMGGKWCWFGRGLWLVLHSTTGACRTAVAGSGHSRVRSPPTTTTTCGLGRHTRDRATSGGVGGNGLANERVSMCIASQRRKRENSSQSNQASQVGHSGSVSDNNAVDSLRQRLHLHLQHALSTGWW